MFTLSGHGNTEDYGCNLFVVCFVHEDTMRLTRACLTQCDAKIPRYDTRKHFWHSGKQTHGRMKPLGIHDLISKLLGADVSRILSLLRGVAYAHQGPDEQHCNLRGVCPMGHKDDGQQPVF